MTCFQIKKKKIDKDSYTEISGSLKITNLLSASLLRTGLNSTGFCKSK
jgi:hypothetical protein